MLRRTKAAIEKRFYWLGCAKDIQLAKRQSEHCVRYYRPACLSKYLKIVVRGAYFIEHAAVNVWGSIVFIEAMQVTALTSPRPLIYATKKYLLTGLVTRCRRAFLKLLSADNIYTVLEQSMCHLKRMNSNSKVLNLSIVTPPICIGG